jgi:rSAM/selenodomain-associated transferase 1
VAEKFRTTQRPRQRLLVFARFPEAGRVKTRLAREIGDDRALAAYRAMLEDLWSSIGPSSHLTEIEVSWSGGEEAGGEEIASAFPGYPLSMQSGGNLGERLVVAFAERFFFHRVEKLIAIGTDDPMIPRELLDAAFRLLDSCEWVIGPASDGGYYLIGMRADAFRPRVFEGIPWGEESVFAETMGKIRALNGTVAVLPWRSDLDRAEDLAAYAERNREGALAALLRQWEER